MRVRWTGGTSFEPPVSAPARFDPVRLIEALAARGADFVIVGGVAAGVHGSAYPTYETLAPPHNATVETTMGSLHLLAHPGGAPRYEHETHHRVERAADPAAAERVSRTRDRGTVRRQPDERHRAEREPEREQ